MLEIVCSCRRQNAEQDGDAGASSADAAECLAVGEGLPLEDDEVRVEVDRSSTGSHDGRELVEAEADGVKRHCCSSAWSDWSGAVHDADRGEETVGGNVEEISKG